MKSIDQFLSRQATLTYNCWDFAVEVWADATGEDLKARMPGLAAGDTLHRLSLKGARSFTRLEAPVSPCLALMERPQHGPHIGVFLEGRIIHLPDGSMAEYQTPKVAMRGFRTIRWYK